MDLSRSKIKYLLIIQRLSRETGNARSVDIAIRLGVARPSVHRMLSTMAEAGLIHMEPRSAVSLTPAGRKAAEAFNRQYEQVYSFFSEELGLSAYDAEQSVIAALSSLPQVCIEALCAHCGKGL